MQAGFLSGGRGGGSGGGSKARGRGAEAAAGRGGGGSASSSLDEEKKPMPSTATSPPSSPPPDDAPSSSTSSRSLSDCLDLLRGPTDERRLVGLLLATRVLPRGDATALRAAKDAIGGSFLERLLLPLDGAGAHRNCLERSGLSFEVRREGDVLKKMERDLEKQDND